MILNATVNYGVIISYHCIDVHPTMAIARTSKRLHLRSEASARFERGCDPEGIDRAARRVIELIFVLEIKWLGRHYGQYLGKPPS